MRTVELGHWPVRTLWSNSELGRARSLVGAHGRAPEGDLGRCAHFGRCAHLGRTRNLIKPGARSVCTPWSNSELGRARSLVGAHTLVELGTCSSSELGRCAHLGWCAHFGRAGAWSVRTPWSSSDLGRCRHRWNIALFARRWRGRGPLPLARGAGDGTHRARVLCGQGGDAPPCGWPKGGGSSARRGALCSCALLTRCPGRACARVRACARWTGAAQAQAAHPLPRSVHSVEARCARVPCWRGARAARVRACAHVRSGPGLRLARLETGCALGAWARRAWPCPGGRAPADGPCARRAVARAGAGGKAKVQVAGERTERNSRSPWRRAPCYRTCGCMAKVRGAGDCAGST